MKLLKNFTSIFLVLNATVFVLAGCVAQSVSGTTASYKISISTEVDEPVEGGMTVATEALGQVHLGKPVLAAEISDTKSIVDDGNLYRAISFESLGPERIVNLSPRLFLQRAEVTGMKEEDILEALRSDALAPGSPVFLVIETVEKRLAFKLKTTCLDHPDHVYIQTDLKKAKWIDIARATSFEIHSLKDAGDPEAVEFSNIRTPLYDEAGSPVLQGTSLYAGDSLFTITKSGKIAGMPSWFKIIREGKDLGLSEEDLESLSDRHVWKDPNKTCPSLAEIQVMHGRHMLMTWKEPRDSKVYASRVIFWSSPPGIQFEMDEPWRLEEIKRGLRNLGISGLGWSSFDYMERGISISGGTL